MMLLLVVLVAAAAVAAFFYLRGNTGGVALDPQQFRSFVLRERTAVSPDTFLFRFGLAHERQCLGLPVGQHITVRGECNGEMVQHSYTPVSGNAELGHVDFIIKVYRPCAAHPRGGRLSQYLADLPLGSRVEMRGPSGRLTYLGCGRLSAGRAVVGPVSSIAMLAGGTGITPMMQVLRAIEADANDRTRVVLVCANRHETDILLREELDALAAKRPGQIEVHHTLTAPDVPDTWKHHRGRISEKMCRELLPSPAAGDSFALMCGSTEMVAQTLRPALLAMGYPADKIFAF